MLADQEKSNRPVHRCAEEFSMPSNGPFSRRLRVVHVVPQLQTGGMEKLLVEFARYADRERFDLHFVSLESRGTLADDIEACGWPVTALDVHPGLRPGLIFRLVRLFRRWKADVVHTHNTKPLLYACLAARLSRVRGLLHTRHGRNADDTRRQKIAFRLATRLADGVVCVSRDSASLSQREGIAAKKISTIWNGIDVSRFSYQGPVAEGPVVMVGRLSPEKDVETLLRASAIIVPQHPAFRLQIAGDGPLLPVLKRLASDLNLDRYVEFLGEVRDIPALLARASLLTLPSLTEGISLSLLEAMARGLPIVATWVGGNTEVVSEGETGFLVPPGSPSDLAAAILRLLDDPARSREMGLAGRCRVESYFDVRRMVREYEDRYLSLCSGIVALADPSSAG